MINILVTLMLTAMMFEVGLGVTVAELQNVLRNWRLVGKSLLANYGIVPALTLGSLLYYLPDDTVSAAFLILAVCPGAPFGPPCAAIARGNVPVAVGLMTILAASSAIVAPVLLYFLLPVVSDDSELRVNGFKVLLSLLITQLIPLAIGLAVRHRFPSWAKRWHMVAKHCSGVMTVMTLGAIVWTHYPSLLSVRPGGFVLILMLVVMSFVAGWVCGTPGLEIRKATSLTTALRNVGVGLVIVTGNFADPLAITAILSYAFVEIFASLFLAASWRIVGGNSSEPRPDEVSLHG